MEWDLALNTLTQSQFVAALAEMGIGYATILLGAGASRTSGVLLAREIVHDITAAEYCHENGISVDSRSRVPVTEVRSWLELQSWYRLSRSRGESDYSAVFRQFKPTRDHQVRYITQLLEGTSASRAYHGLAHLMRSRHFPVVLTTNFDPLLENCYKGKFQTEASLRVVESPEAFALTTIETDRILLAHLHGNVNGYDIANLDEDTRLLIPEIESAARRLLNPTALVVIGYSGNDNSVMGMLEHLAKEDPSAFRRGVVYWCHTHDSTPSPRVMTFLNQVTQGFTVSISGFDQVIEAVCERHTIGLDEFRLTRPTEPSQTGDAAPLAAALNLSLFESLPEKMLRYRTGLKRRDDLKAFIDEHCWWQGTVHDGELWLIGDPTELPASLLQAISATPKEIPLNARTLEEPLNWNIFRELANKALTATLIREHSLREFKGHRFFFSKPKNSDERIIKYFSRKRMAQRSVVWKEFERGSAETKTAYFCHEAVRPSVGRFRNIVALIIAPTRIFTVEGDEVWDTTTARTSIGRSTGKMWNESYDSLVRLWLDVLSRESETVTVRFSADGRKPAYRLQFSNRPLVARRTIK